LGWPDHNSGAYLLEERRQRYGENLP
jgi:hypothetical protein